MLSHANTALFLATEQLLQIMFRKTLLVVLLNDALMGSPKGLLFRWLIHSFTKLYKFENIKLIALFEGIKVVSGDFLGDPYPTFPEQLFELRETHCDAAIVYSLF